MSDQRKTKAQLLAELAELRRQVARLETEQVRSNERLHDSEERYHSVADFTYDWEYWLGPDDQFRYMSPSCERVTGYSAQAFIDHPALLDEIVHPDDQTVWIKHVHRFAGGEVEPIELRIVHRNGQERWISHVCRQVFSEGGQSMGRRASNRDITVRKRAEAEIRLRTAALEAAANGIVITDRNGQILWVNPAMSRLTGYSFEEVIHQNPRLLKSGVHDRDFYKNLWDTVLAGEVWHGEVINRRKDGSLYTEEQMITPVRAAGGEITHFIAIKQDVTERKRVEEALRQSNIELRARNEDLDAFAHTVAHDLKSPVALVIGYSDELIIETDLATEEDLRQGLAAIARAGHKLNSIINELLLLAEIRTSEVARQPLDMGRLVREATQRLMKISTDQHAEIVLPETWPVALGYGPWIEEVWVNYLSNALKYGGSPSTPPQIELGAEAQPDGLVRFWLRDHGPGIPAESQAHLFTQFTRLDQVRAQGHGLGLSIVRRIVEKLGGQVGVISQVGQGSTFFFALPGANAEH